MKPLFTEVPLKERIIRDPFWSPRLEVNRRHGLIYQWEKYEEVGTIDNFRIAAGMKEGTRQGFFYVDSDLHKWADAASRVRSEKKDSALQKLLDEYIRIVTAAQEDDGYLYTFNQIHFPGMRWVNLQIEHELYCMGHFIEAGIEHFLATGKTILLAAVEKTARLICDDFSHPRSARTPGHQEIELALLRLYRLTGNEDYRITAENFLNMRGRKRLFGLRLISEFRNHQKRMKEVARLRGEEKTGGFDYTETTGSDEPFLINLRLALAFLSGRYHQQHRPVARQKKPAGHAVRWVYMQTARAMSAAEREDAADIEAQERLWESLVNGWMYVTGGIGSLPLIEGFGRKYELSSRYAYCETCAAIGSIFWNHELFRATRDPRYADMIEWQLYNAASVGVSSTGDAWFYRNPLDSKGGIDRRPWFDTACCPSNVSRLQASLGRYIAHWEENSLYLGLYCGCRTITGPGGHSFSMESELPRAGKVKITARAAADHDLAVYLRIPAWCEGVTMTMNGLDFHFPGGWECPIFGTDFFNRSRYEKLTVPAGKKNVITLEMAMPLRVFQARILVASARGRVALARGPLVYCLEESFNRGIGHDGACLLPARIAFKKEKEGPGSIIGADRSGGDLVFTPYHGWGNSGYGWMQVWVRARGDK